jgi:hypothetical protein
MTLPHLKRFGLARFVIFVAVMLAVEKGSATFDRLFPAAPAYAKNLAYIFLIVFIALIPLWAALLRRAKLIRSPSKP